MKKGFTLIELLAVITIMGVILLISVPNITKQLKQTKANQYIEFTDDLFLATESYITSHLDTLNLKSPGNTEKINIERLIKTGYFKSTTVNPKTNKKVNINSYIQVVINPDNTYKYTFIDSDNITCSAYKSDELSNDSVGKVGSVEKDYFAQGVAYKCDPGDGEKREFYVISSTQDSIKLILKQNIGKNVSYDKAYDYLIDSTKKWSDVYVSLPSGTDLISASWNSSPEEITNIDNFIYSNTSCLINDCSEKIKNMGENITTNGYWINKDINENAWTIQSNKVSQEIKTEENKIGVRPVITVLKSNLEKGE